MAKNAQLDVAKNSRLDVTKDVRRDLAGRILVVDDEASNVEVFSRLMSRFGYEVLTATSGELALESVERDRPDLVLLDVNMPGIDGFEVCRRLKSDTRTRLIPIVLITGLNATEDRVRGIEAGADDFLAKPPVVAELEARVRSLTRLKRYTDVTPPRSARVSGSMPTSSSRSIVARFCTTWARSAFRTSFF